MNNFLTLPNLWEFRLKMEFEKFPLLVHGVTRLFCAMRSLKISDFERISLGKFKNSEVEVDLG